MRVTSIYLKYDGPFAGLPVDISRALAVIDATQRGGLIWYAQEWDFYGIEEEPQLPAGVDLEEWCRRLANECTRLGDAAAAHQTLRCVGQICWGRLLGYAQEPPPGFCADLMDVEGVEMPITPPLVCAIQMLDCTAVGIVTLDKAIAKALKQNDLAAKSTTYVVDETDRRPR